MREIAYDPALRASRSVVEVEHKERGTYLTVGCPVTFSDFTPEITGSPLLGEHSDDVLADWDTTPTP
jgi:formyl-CoA transferase